MTIIAASKAMVRILNQTAYIPNAAKVAAPPATNMNIHTWLISFLCWLSHGVIMNVANDR